MFSGLCLLGLFAAATRGVHAYYLPGLAARDYSKNEPVQLTVNSLAARESMSLLPYDFYYEKFHFCKPVDMEVERESLGSVLFGDRMYNSAFQIKSVPSLCSAKISAEDAKFINLRIKEDYFMDWYIDNLPAAQYTQDEEGTPFYQIGFALGQLYTDEGSETDKAPVNLYPFLNNHYDITVEYHTKDNVTFRVVGVLVTPRSVASIEGSNKCDFTSHTADLELSEKQDTTVEFSYSVTWKLSETPWATRWDKYLHVTHAKIHWFSILNSIVVVVVLTVTLAVVLLRALHKDISRYNSLLEENFGEEEIGWKLLHADVFRPPGERVLLAVLVGSGVQLFLMAAISIFLSALGFLSPSSRGSLTTLALVCYMLLSGVAGYTSSRLYKMMKGDNLIEIISLSATLVPGYLSFILFMLNFVLVRAESSAAVPSTTMLIVLSIWFVVSVPLCILGGCIGFNQPTLEDPVSTKQIPREIPPQSMILQTWVTCLMSGVIPFAAIYIELYFIMNSIWFHQVYYMFGFLFLVFLILATTASEIAILVCYNHLCAEDWRWAWRSFLGPAMSGLYMLLFSIVYCFCGERSVFDYNWQYWIH
ncbi:hypothetical protein BDR26DRAFT_849725 [Obelidium mucronatum]|nr:hypothetical protein BDR26DRAFT_849725 [Obelidium mucronatum]